ncbi:hypothetical protein F0L74_25225 [Chitinophaga agrisoli]|uniref:Uncharacterized protein n=1 Tax=Chitinophaga agrisoli TaxID=2607653 RepID=A0A5B2VKI2_9BACT|nr:hypothetical protein [Chitinophaga agrisoli]KAA2239505.1 hypothetical protein F0L74_25225 [Chitinophaga agrisoli]
MLTQCVSFLNAIGIPTLFRKIEKESFLPGFLIEHGAIVIDEQALEQPGDILHEAGHIAVVPAADRPKLMGATIIDRRDREAEEMMAIAWSYAVCIYLQIDPHFVFHDKGYNGGSSYITDTCSKNIYFGIPMLQAIGLTANDYPDVVRWLRE